MATEIDYYEQLQVDRGCDGATLKSSYRKLAMQFHPDRNPGDAEAEAKFKAISEAYDVLKDPQKRAAYDRYGHAAFTNGGGNNAGGGGFAGAAFNDIGDIFETIFGGGNAGGGFGGQQQRGPARGADLRYDMEITLEEAFHGQQTEIEIDVSVACEECEGSGSEPGTGTKICPTCHGHGKVRAQQGFFVVERTCATCQGRGEIIESPCHVCYGEGRVDKPQTLEVEIPAGVDTGTRIRLSGKGEAGARGAAAGDLYIFIHLKRHPIFERDGTTLFTRAPISFSMAALGGEITIPGLDGTKHDIRIPAGIQSGKQIRQRGAGMPVLRGRGHGDMVVQIDVETPTKLTKEQRQILRQFQETETGAESPQSDGFFTKLKGAWEDLTE
ncbi:MAG: molecular chaperone DnaJ [Pseudomonadota bacterium]